eukprot:TRINITY_DN25676_c0_g1_i1.p3 TRINITY_DN25676_c0_g1~~TRINITY_DN25676_c0_g1_i1.p3  ORF type:complete len:120 (-),score=24.85 TRINITY_DN25676_c0_g1_i1:815-1174(-)
MPRPSTRRFESTSIQESGLARSCSRSSPSRLIGSSWLLKRDMLQTEDTGTLMAIQKSRSLSQPGVTHALLKGSNILKSFKILHLASKTLKVTEALNIAEILEATKVLESSTVLEGPKVL